MKTLFLTHRIQYCQSTINRSLFCFLVFGHQSQMLVHTDNQGRDRHGQSFVQQESGDFPGPVYFPFKGKVIVSLIMFGS